MTKKKNNKLERENKKDTSEAKQEDTIKLKKEDLDKKVSLYAYAIIGLIVLAILFFGFIFIKEQLDKSFNYKGMEFHKETRSNVNVYATDFIIKSYAGATLYIDNRTFYFRNDPRNLNLEKFPEEGVKLLIKNKVYVSLDEPLPICKNNFIASYELGATLKIYGLDIEGAVLNASKSKGYHPEITCENSTKNTVIIIGPDTFNGVEKIKENCYKLSYKKCDILKTTEGFSLKLLEQAVEEIQNK
jgi:hypothetical protein